MIDISLISIEQEGIRVRLTQGNEQSIPLHLSDGRKITISYNLQFSKKTLINQKPDMVITIERPHWPKVRLLLDAKYRIDQSSSYRKSYGVPGPPEDAINVLHRYRDAIIEEDSSDELTRTVIQGAAVYPYHDENGEFERSRLWNSLEVLGIGAIPLLPAETKYLDQWLEKMLKKGGWSVADSVIPHSTSVTSIDWKQAETEYVRIGLLRGGVEKEHLKWIIENQKYYYPASKAQPRQYQAQWLAIYTPASMRDNGAITHVARIREIDVVPRDEIQTPWSSYQKDFDSPQILCKLDEVKEMENPIVNQLEDDEVPGMPYRWTTRLGLRRAFSPRELLLETEAEWRLKEELDAAGIEYSIRAGRVGEGNVGRASFLLGDLRITYWGMDGFKVDDGDRTFNAYRVFFQMMDEGLKQKLNAQYGSGWLSRSVALNNSRGKIEAVFITSS